jgi:RNA polymerase sigma-70 factor (ECF subfamily)
MPDRLKTEEEQLLRKAQAGNADAFGKLYERHMLGVFRFLYSRLGNRADAEDLTEEVFLKAWQALARYEQRGLPYSAFLMRIARNLLTDHYRKMKHEAHTTEMDSGQLAQTARPGSDPAARSRLDGQPAFQVLQGLREDYQIVLTLRFISQLSVDETAKVMRRTPGAVRVLQHRALRALRGMMEENDEETSKKE